LNLSSSQIAAKSVRKVALITGASSGIGFSAALELARCGFVVYAGTRNASRAQEVADGLKQISADSQLVRLDITDPADVQAVVERIVAESGRIDVVVNNAGYRLEGFIEDTSFEEARSQIETNLMGPINVIKSVLPYMRAARNGRIINISCLAGQVGEPGASIFCASKYGLEGLSEGLRHELLADGIFVSVVIPGPVCTQFYSKNLRIATLAHVPTRPHFERMRRISFYQDIATRYSSNTVDEIGRAIAKVAETQTPRFRYYAGGGTFVQRTLKRALPSRLWQRIMASRMRLPK